MPIDIEVWGEYLFIIYEFDVVFIHFNMYIAKFEIRFSAINTIDYGWIKN